MLTHKILVGRIQKKKKEAFNKLWAAFQENQKGIFKIRRAVRKRYRKIIGFGF